MADPASFSRDYWRVGGTVCSLSVLDGNIEVTLRDERGLVAVWPCGNYVEASSVSYDWWEQRPQWLAEEDSTIARSTT